jgi:hypothetical protein
LPRLFRTNHINAAQRTSQNRDLIANMAKFRRLSSPWMSEFKGPSMSTMHEDKSNEKPRQRGRKAGRGRTAKAEARDDVQIDAMIASSDVPGSGAAAPVAPSASGDVEAAEVIASEEVAAEVAAPIEAVVSAAENAPVNMQTIANACRDYTRESVQENRRFVERLMGVRSFDKAVEVQTDFATQAYANFVAQSQRICGLYSQLAGQAFRLGKRHA